MPVVRAQIGMRWMPLSEFRAYHGTKQSFTQFDRKQAASNGREYGPGIYFSTSSADADEYAGDDEGSNVHMVDLAGLKFWDVAAPQAWSDVLDELGVVPEGEEHEPLKPGTNGYLEMFRRMQDDSWGPADGDLGEIIAGALKVQGFQGIRIPAAMTGSRKGDWYTVFNPKNVRYAFAK